MIIIQSMVDWSFAGVFDSNEAFYNYLKSMNLTWKEEQNDEDFTVYVIHDENNDWVDNYTIKDYELNTRFGDRYL